MSDRETTNWNSTDIARLLSARAIPRRQPVPGRGQELVFATREGIEAGSARLAKLLRGNNNPVAIQKIIRAFMFPMGTSNTRMP